MLTDRQIRSIGKAILLYRSLPAPREFHRNPAKNRWLCGGNRSGRSEGKLMRDLGVVANLLECGRIYFQV